MFTCFSMFLASAGLRRAWASACSPRWGSDPGAPSGIFQWLFSGIFQRLVTFPVDFHRKCPKDCRWYFPMEFHFCDFWCVIFCPEHRGLSTVAEQAEEARLGRGQMGSTLIGGVPRSTSCKKHDSCSDPIISGNICNINWYHNSLFSNVHVRVILVALGLIPFVHFRTPKTWKSQWPH